MEEDVAYAEVVSGGKESSEDDNDDQAEFTRLLKSGRAAVTAFKKASPERGEKYRLWQQARSQRKRMRQSGAKDAKASADKNR